MPPADIGEGSDCASVRKFSRLIPRMLASLIVGLGVFLIACVPARRNYSRAADFYIPQRLTRDDMATIQRLTEAYQRGHRVLPKTLAEIQPGEGEDHFRTNEAGRPTDWWGHPLRYWTDGTDYRLTSYGRDGRPGGVGLDTDVSSDDSGWTRTEPTFKQFLTDKEARGMRTWCALGGVAAFILGLFLVRAPIPTRQDFAKAIIRLLVTAAAAAWLTGLLSVLHIPSGH